MERGLCDVCGEAATQTCANCTSSSYCGKEHQKEDWPVHKASCKPYKVEVSTTLGRHIIAARDIKAGELIVREAPLIMGPRVDSVPLCLGCYKTACRPQGDPRLCSLCGVAPVCSEECETAPPHADTECGMLARMAKLIPEDWTLVDNLQIVLPLRCLLMRVPDGTTSTEWDHLMKLESHTTERRNTPVWEMHNDKVVEFLRTTGVVNNAEDAEMMQKICGILDVNCFELRGPNPALMTHSGRHGERLRGVYLEAALMSHDCVGNTHLSVDDNYLMSIHASMAISAGQPILFNYASALESTPERFQRLREGKYFACTCPRCSDPTELGTYMSAIICSRCHDGLVVPCNPQHQTDGVDRWGCDKCGHTYNPRLIRATVTLAWSQIEDADNSDIRAMENLLKKYSRTFPQTSVVMVEIKQNLVALYREVILREPSPSRKVLQRKINLCVELLQVLIIVEPGISRLRGITLYELHIPQVILANREYDSGDITALQLLEKLNEAETTLKDAISMLLYEPANSPEGKLLKIAIDELRVLRDSVQDVKVLHEQQSSEDGRKGNKRKLFVKRNKK